MYQLKQISAESIPKTLEKALRYRLLNEPLQAESICRDVLEIDAGNQQALTTLLLALTDQFEKEFPATFHDAQQLLPQIHSEYQRTYYEGTINERWGNAHLGKGEPTSVGWYRAAMRSYAKAEALSDPDDDDAVLRWNACARIIQRHDFARESVSHDVAAEFGDDMPLH